ncbi:hypothetical protein CIW51_32050 [Mycolicibacterium sp. P9-22]|nr:hypothetical protein CIW51_32050 [Mycolicibacterium sp. P9-22]
MDQGDETRAAGAATHTEYPGAWRVGSWDTLRANAIGSLWGRSTKLRIDHGDVWALRADSLR